MRRGGGRNVRSLPEFLFSFHFWDVPGICQDVLDLGVSKRAKMKLDYSSI